jgi:hypothetical protein
MDTEKLLLAEYKHFSELLWKNEEAGERRVNFFIILATAFVTAMVALWKSNAANNSINAEAALFITIVALVGLLLFGIVTFMRMLQRDDVTDEYKGIIDYLRDQLKSQAQGQGQEQGLSAYKLPFRKQRSPWLRGGLAFTVAAMNVVIVFLLAWIFLNPWRSWNLLIIGSITGGIAGFHIGCIQDRGNKATRTAYPPMRKRY